MKNFSTSDSNDVMAIRRRSEQAIIPKIKERIYHKSGCMPRVQTKRLGNFTYFLFTTDSCKLAFTINTRRWSSRDFPTIIIEESAVKRLIKLNRCYDIVRHLVMFNDGHTVVLDVTKDSYTKDVRLLPRRTVTKSGKDYIEKKICLFDNKHHDESLDFDKDWVFDRKKVAEVSKPEDKPKALF